MHFLGREPTLWISFIASLILLLGTHGLHAARRLAGSSLPPHALGWM